MKIQRQLLDSKCNNNRAPFMQELDKLTLRGEMNNP